MRIGSSASSCEQLGWTNAGEYGSTAVCANSKVGDVCSGFKPWTGANNFCEGVGARLCSAAELKRNEAKFTACGLDSELVWTGTTCALGAGAIGRLQAYGSSSGIPAGGPEDFCMDSSSPEVEAPVRCCADVFAPTNDPTLLPTTAPSMTLAPVLRPTATPTTPKVPTSVPVLSPTRAPTVDPSPMPTEPVFFGNNKFPPNLTPRAYTNKQTGTVFSSAELWSLKADNHWVEGQIWTLQVTVSSQCADNPLTYGFAYDGGTHLITIPALANHVTLTVVDLLKASFSTTFFQARSKCGVGSEPTVTFHSMEMAWGDVTSPRPSLLPTTTPVPTQPVFFGTNIFPVGLTPYNYTNAQGGTVYSSAQLATMKADPKWAHDQVWTLQVVASSQCTENALAFGFSADGGSHIFFVPASADRAHFTVVGPLKASFATNFFQARSKCGAAGSNPTVTFHSIEMAPGDVRTPFPSHEPTTTQRPTSDPTQAPTPKPSYHPTSQPTLRPVPRPSPAPTSHPTLHPIPRPTPRPTSHPTPHPSERPIPVPTKVPIQAPTQAPRPIPTRAPHPPPTFQPSPFPSQIPRPNPTQRPSTHPTLHPTQKPTPQQSSHPSSFPTRQPTAHPLPQPSRRPSMKPTAKFFPTIGTPFPTLLPTSHPSAHKTLPPSSAPEPAPSPEPSSKPTLSPSAQPAPLPTFYPITRPSKEPSERPTAHPTGRPVQMPTTNPTSQPTIIPLPQPTLLPHPSPSAVQVPAPSALPVSVPTLDPSAVPTLTPALTPTVPATAPTSFACATADDGSYDPSPYLRELRPKLVVLGGSAYPLKDISLNQDGASYQRPFGLFSAGAQPGSAFNFAATVSGVQVGAAGGGGTTLMERINSLDIVVKTPTVYPDSVTLQVAYQAHDAFGHAQVLTSGLTVSLLFETDTFKSATVPCGAPDGTSGVGLCTASVAADWFSTSADVGGNLMVHAKYGSTVVASSESLPWTLRLKPTFTALSAAGMQATVPFHPLMPGDVFDAAFVANTNGQALSVWVLSLTFDADVLTFMSATTSSSYIAAVVTAETGTLSLSTSGLASGVSSAAVTGSSVAVVNLRFTVKSGASAGVFNALTCTVVQMVNEFSIAFANNVAGQFNDNRGGAQIDGQVTVSSLSLVGLFAYTALSELLNAAPLTGTAVTSTIQSIGVYNRANKNNAAVSGTCSRVEGGKVLSLSDCSVTADATHSAGVESMPITVSYGELASSVRYRVWYPETVRIESTDNALGPVLPDTTRNNHALNGSINDLLNAYQTGTCSRRFQTAELTAYARFSTGSDNRTVDVTRLVTFVSSNTTVAVISSSSVSGRVPGIAEVTVELLSPSVSQDSPVTLTVTDTLHDAASVQGLTVILYSGTSWITSVDSVSLSGKGEPTVEFNQALSAEGDTASVVVYAEFSDGTYEDVTSESVLTSIDSSVSVSGSALIVEVGALTMCSPAVLAAWSLCDVPVATGSGVVVLDMPSAVSVLVMPSSLKIAEAGDGATLSPFGIPSLVTVTVTVEFDDGSTKDFSSDDRTLITVTTDGSESLVQVSGNTVSVLAGASISVGSTAALLVSFPGVFSVNNSVSLSVVKLESLTVTSTPFPSVLGYSGDVTRLGMIACSGVYQRLEARATAALSDGTTRSDVDLYKRVEFSSNFPSVATFSSAPCWSSICRGLVPLSAGSTAISGSFGGLSATKVVTVEDVARSVTSLSIASDVGTSSTLSGFVGTSDVLTVMVGLSDGTSIAVAASGATSSGWLAPATMLVFSSAQASAINVSGAGVVSLQGNYFASVALTASDTCGSGVPAAVVDVYANLAPATYDVDLGATMGAPLGSVSVGDRFSVPVRVQGLSNQDVTAFQIIVTFDPTLVVVASDTDCVIGSGWKSTFECTTNDPVNEVLIVGSCGLSPSTGCGSRGLLTVATITFEAISAGTTEVSGLIVKIKDDVTTTADTVIVAGTSSLVVVSSRRHLTGDHGPDLFSAIASASWSAPLLARRDHRALVDCAKLLGDTNGDCTFDVEDVQYMQYFIGGALDNGSLSAQQLSAMDPNLDGNSDGVDISYLMKVVASKYRFLSSFSADTAPFSIAVGVRTANSEPATGAQTRVSFEVGTALNDAAGFRFAVGLDASDTADGVVVTAEGLSPGVFTVNASAVPFAEAGVGVVIMIETLDASGTTSLERRFAFYCTRLVEACVSVFGDTPAAFRPFALVELRRQPSPSSAPTAGPTYSEVPSTTMSAAPSAGDTRAPTLRPTAMPTRRSSVPSALPTSGPTLLSPSLVPVFAPTVQPSTSASSEPSIKPSAILLTVPSAMPSTVPSAVPLAIPSAGPALQPSLGPALAPSAEPSRTPAPSPLPPPPAAAPTLPPLPQPNALPSVRPTSSPVGPTRPPTATPTLSPTAGDTATVSLSVAMAAPSNDPPSASEVEGLKGSVLSATGLDPATVRNFEVLTVPPAAGAAGRVAPAAAAAAAAAADSEAEAAADSEAVAEAAEASVAQEVRNSQRRRLRAFGASGGAWRELQPQARHLEPVSKTPRAQLLPRQLAGTIWVAAFDVTLSLSHAHAGDGGSSLIANASSPADLAARLAASLAKPTFAASVAAAVPGVSVDPASVTSIIATRRPSPQPSLRPTRFPSPAPTACADKADFCSAAAGSCDAWFCPSCSLAHLCDATCDLCPFSRRPTAAPVAPPVHAPSSPPVPGTGSGGDSGVEDASTAAIVGFSAGGVALLAALCACHFPRYCGVQFTLRVAKAMNSLCRELTLCLCHCHAFGAC